MMRELVSGPLRQVSPLQDRHELDGHIARVPLLAVLLEPHTQSVVVDEQRVECAPQSLLVPFAGQFQEH